jgi:hypothetical protein
LNAAGPFAAELNGKKGDRVNLSGVKIAATITDTATPEPV